MGDIFTFSLPYHNGISKKIRVYVPEHVEGERLPVIYMTDGQNLFEDDYPGQFGCWYTREAVDEEYKLSGRAAVIVGIHNDESIVQRTNELTPESIGEVILSDALSKEEKEGFEPLGEVFDDFVVNTVIPAVEKRFDVKTDRNSRAFCGSSSGGLQSFFTALSHPELFCSAGVFSPAFLLYSTEDIVNWGRSRLCDDMPYLYVYTGAGDELERKIFISTDEVYDSLMDFYPMDKMNEVVLPEEGHHENAWAEIFKDFLHTFLN